MELTKELVQIIFANFHRYCNDCKAYMQPLSTMCRSCGLVQPFVKVDKMSYVEHFELKKCEIHESGFHYCIHPGMDSTFDELHQYCVFCVFGKFEVLGPIYKNVSTPGAEEPTTLE